MLDGITLEQLGAIAWHIQRGDNVLNITSTHTVDGDMDYISIHLRTGDVYNYNTDGTDRHDV